MKASLFIVFKNNLIILGAIKFSDFGVQAFRLANLSIWTEKLFSSIRKPARVEYKQNT
jgi:hypothetical protein